MERKKRYKGMGWESCYVKKIYGTFGVKMRAYGQKLVKFCTHTAKLVVEKQGYLQGKKMKLEYVKRCEII